jgi:hypothetical protein
MTNTARLIYAALAFGALAGAATGCGGDKPAPADLSKFVGSWSVTSGALTISCTDHRVQVIAITEPTQLILGTGSDLIDTDATCPVLYDVVGTVASALPGQTCNHPDVITKMNLFNDTFTTADGVTATHEASGALNSYNDITLGNPVNCTFVEMGLYQRMGN